MSSNQYIQFARRTLKLCAIAALPCLFTLNSSLAARTVETENFSLTPQTVAPLPDGGLIPDDAAATGEADDATIRISYDVTLLPVAVQKTRQAMINAMLGAFRTIASHADETH